MGYLPIEDYGLIGDLQTVALVGKNGSIDFMCFPEFDSPSIFAALLDDKKGGRFQISPVVDDRLNLKQLYLPDSNILLTRFLSGCGIAEVSDFMAIEKEEHHQKLIRRAKAVRGDMKFELVCDPQFNYARTGHKIKWLDRGTDVLFIPDDDKFPTLRLATEQPLKEVEGKIVAEFVLKEGETAAFVLEEYHKTGHKKIDHPTYVAHAFKETINYWHRWVSQSNYRGRWREMVNRSALTLKMLTSRKYGSIVAAPTFGLPEELGGERNWDYRFTWIRDASFTLYALIRLGYTEEAGAFMSWIEDRCQDLNPDGSLQIMYGLDGTKHLTEETLDHFEGYRGSKPVRIGNAAYGQLQQDIYGELMDSVYLYNKYGSPISIDLWDNLSKLINWVVENWRRKGEGIWEVRGGVQGFLYSKVMCWVAIDRAIRLAHKRSFPAPLEHWIRTRDEIYRFIVTEFWNPKKKAFVQHLGGTAMDASALLMPMIKFISPTDPRWISTLDRIDKELVVDSLVYRYNTDDGAHDGLSGTEGTFNMCSFWFIECLSRSGDYERARFYFEKILGYANHLGLYAEEMGLDGSQLGNFPQAFTHLALISAAYDIDRNLTKRHINW